MRNYKIWGGPMLVNCHCFGGEGKIWGGNGDVSDLYPDA